MKDDNMFDFSDQVFGESPQEKEKPKTQMFLDRTTEVQTSYILVNALLNLLVRKGIIYPHEVNDIVKELHEEYVKRKRGD